MSGCEHDYCGTKMFYISHAIHQFHYCPGHWVAGRAKWAMPLITLDDEDEDEAISSLPNYFLSVKLVDIMEEFRSLFNPLM